MNAIFDPRGLPPLQAAQPPQDEWDEAADLDPADAYEAALDEDRYDDDEPEAQTVTGSYVPPSTPNVMPLASFLEEFGGDLMAQMQSQNPVLYLKPHDVRAQRLDSLLRRPFPEQAEAVQALATLLLDPHGDSGERFSGGILNGEMGTGKTLMGIALAHLLHHEGFPRTLVICPPHLVYKWRREIMATVPGAKVWTLNGTDTLAKLIELRKVRFTQPSVPQFFIMGRTRMRMGFHWKPAYLVLKRPIALASDADSAYVERGGKLQRDYGGVGFMKVAVCGHCYTTLSATGTSGVAIPMTPDLASVLLTAQRSNCKQCRTPLWTLTRPQSATAKSADDLMHAALTQIPTIGLKTAETLVQRFGAGKLKDMLVDSPTAFSNLMDDEGEFVFPPRRARRIEKSLADIEFSFGQGGYQPTEFIKRQLPQGFFGCLLVDEGHEYKNDNSAQGQAMGVLARKASKTVLLTGTLMGGYASDLFHLLWRLDPKPMLEDGFKPNARGTMFSAELGFMREHGILIDVLKQRETDDHRTSRAKTHTVSTKKGPGFSPKGVMQYILPRTYFLRLRDMPGAKLPTYTEFYEGVQPDETMLSCYRQMSFKLTQLMKAALVAGDNSLLGVVTTALLAWPECAFRDERVLHPRTRRELHFQPAIYPETLLGVEAASPKERKVLTLCLEAKQRGRKTLLYTIYTGTRDTSSRLKDLLETAGLKVAVMRSTVKAELREAFVEDHVERGVDVLICNPELVKTGLDLLDFPTIVFAQTGYNVYTVQQAARRSWRIGQTQPVEVFYLGYEQTAQMTCLQLMGKKINVSQSTSGDMPESGLDVLNETAGSIETELAKQLMTVGLNT